MKVLITETERNYLLSFQQNLVKRKELPVEVDNFFSKKIQEFGSKCWLRTINNFIRKENSRKKNCSIFHGRYRCVKNDCNVIFVIEYKSKNDNFLDIKYTCNALHETIAEKSVCQRITGKERLLLRRDLAADGISNYLDKAIIKGTQFPSKLARK